MMTKNPGSNGVIVFLAGKQRAGKDTVAEYLVKEYGFKRAAFADKLKELASDLFGMTEKDRGLLIDLGMKMREIDPLVWVKYVWRSKIQAEPDARWVITDGRFLNELEFFENVGAWTIRIDAEADTRAARGGYNPEHENDPSEAEIDLMETDFIIENDFDLMNLYVQVDLIMEGILR